MDERLRGTDLTMTANHRDAIRVHNLVKTYGKNVIALGGISFNVQEGEIFGFLGPNRAGKSTTVRILTTLSSPDRGEAFVSGITVLRQPEKVRRAIGVVASREALTAETERLGVLYGLAGLATLATLSTWFAVRVSRAYQRSM